MMNQIPLFENESPTNLCKSVQKIDKKIEMTGLAGIQSPELTEDIRVISEFFGVEIFESVILVPFIYGKLMNKRTGDINSILSWLKVDLTDVIRIHNSLNRLTAKGIIRKHYDEYDSSYGSITLTDKAYRSVISNKPFPRNSMNYERDGIGFLRKINDKLEILKSEEAGFEDFITEFKLIMDEYETLEGIKYLKGLELEEVELCIALIGACNVMLRNHDNINVEKIMNNLDVGLIKRYAISNELLRGESSLIKKEVIECDRDFFRTVASMTLTEGFKQKILGFEYKPGMKINLKRGKLISPEELKKENLFYNEKEEKEIRKMERILKEEEYDRLRNLLKEQGNSTGIPVLLFGKPGTGKTSTVYDLAVRTGRKVYTVEMETINSSYLGESEKNLMEIFKEYESLMMTEDRHPILLLNECDGIIKKRMKGSTPVSEMMNTMVTLLLNKMDDFNGILFATMNEPNFDEAFERRFLFKMKLETPNTETRKSIMRDVFPGVDESVLNRISEKFTLTGGQISNIKKKIKMETLLDPGFSVDSSLEELCEKEFVLSVRKTRNPIGFVYDGKDQ